MELSEKLQQLRKQKGLTQEELAGHLYVSRAAISKWESGRGYPSIDSLKAAARFFGVSVDELLSADELLSVADEDRINAEKSLIDSVYALLDISCVLLLLLPLFAQRADGVVRSVSVMGLTLTAPYMKAVYMAAILLLAASGVLTLALRDCSCERWMKNKRRIMLAFHAAAVVLFIAGLQPYAAVFLLALLMMKVFLLLRRA